MSVATPSGRRVRHPGAAAIRRRPHARRSRQRRYGGIGVTGQLWVQMPHNLSTPDRVLVRQLRARVVELVSRTAAIYYSDFPYNQFAEAAPAFLAARDLVPWTWDEGIGAKERLIRGYRTQADALFPAGRMPAAPEVYYCPREDRD
jgi:hypothetical protein